MIFQKSANELIKSEKPFLIIMCSYFANHSQKEDRNFGPNVEDPLNLIETN